MENMSAEEKAKLYERLSDIDGNMMRILLILESDRRTNTQGLVEEVRTLRKDMDERILREEIFKSKVITYSSLGAGFALAVGWLVKQVLIYIIR